MVKNIFISDNLYELGKFLKNLMIIKCFESGNMYIFTVLWMKNLGLYFNYFGFVGLILEKVKKVGLLGKGLNFMFREMLFLV